MKKISKFGISYRPEINGLRAIAVLAVILYHAEFTIRGREIFTGGYIGVDVFFVISGYLISKIIFTELNASNRFNILNFYERRIRRILPVLLVVILTSIPFAYLYLYPSGSVEYSKSIIASLFFISNFFFYSDKIAYGAEAAILTPFLHTWSLSVEEQFYIIFPVTTLIVYKYLRQYLVLLIMIAAILSIELAYYEISHDPTRGFYLLHSRVWELLVGVLIAIIDIKIGRNHHYLLHQILPIFGLILITYSYIFFNEATPHPSYYTLFAVLGTGLIIFFSNKKELVGAILSSFPLVGIGLISYSLYLWHFPIFSFAYIVSDDLSVLDKMSLIALSFALSILTFYLIEKPFRNSNFISRKTLLLSTLTGAMTIIFFIGALIPWSYDFKNFEEDALERPSFVQDLKGWQKAWTLHRISVKPQFKDTELLNVLVIGNSHGNDTFNSLELNKDYFNNLEFSQFTAACAVPIRNQSECRSRWQFYGVGCFLDFLKDNSTLCADVDFNSGQNLREEYLRADVILFSTQWDKLDMSRIDEIISILKGENKKIILTSNSNELLNGVPIKKFIKQNNRYPSDKELIEIEKETYNLNANNKSLKILNNKLQDIASSNNVPLLMKDQYLCNDILKRCDVLTPKGALIFWDYGHTTTEGAKYLGQQIISLKWLQPLK
jgi:peptidoglycan/LPS O-acetylase OafA/YrhL